MKNKFALNIGMIVLGLVILSGCGNNTGNVVNELQPNNEISSNEYDQTTSGSDLISVVTAEQLVEHDAENDCWVVVENKVYDVTSYLSNHPGGPQQIIPLCGKDATVAFTTKNKPEPQSHSDQSRDNLEKYYVGELK